MEFTTGWTRKLVRNQSDYDKWLSTLKSGDACIVQEFIPQGDSCLESQIECWRFWTARYQGDCVIYDKDSHQIRKDGLLCYCNSDTPWGRVFAARIVPDHGDLHHKYYDFKDCHAPVFEPDWIDGDRCVFFDSYGPDFGRSLSSVLPRYYRREVNEGELVIAFGRINELKESLKGSNLVFLYAEDLSRKI